MLFRSLDIKFERIQGVNTEQNIVYRYLGLVTLSFDTAGSTGSEGNLPAVSRSLAESLRTRINGTPVSDETANAVSEVDNHVLMSLGWRDMIRIGLADRRALILLAFISPMFQRRGDRTEQLVSDGMDVASSYGLQLDTFNFVLIGIAFVLGLLIIFALASVAAAFLSYHNFKLLLEQQTLRSVGGLLTRHEHSMDLSKIQTLRLQQGIVQNWLGCYRMTARQAVSGGRHAKKKVFDIPVVTAELADQLRRKLLAPEGGTLSQDPLNDQFVRVSRYYMRPWILFGGVLPALIASIAFWTYLGGFSLFFLLWIPVVTTLVFRNWRRAGYLHDDNEIIRRSGWLGYRTVGLLFRKVQRVSVTQSRFQRRKNLASLRLYMASGSVRIPYIDYETANQLRDYILYRVETSQQAWY